MPKERARSLITRRVGFLSPRSIPPT